MVGPIQFVLMPTVLRTGPYRFYFYSHEPNEPPHVHIDRDDLSAKFWLELLKSAGIGDDSVVAASEYVERAKAHRRSLKVED